MNEDIHALSGAYAVDALDEIERARFTRHLSGCTPCQAEVEGLLATAAELAVLTCAAPSDALKVRVLAQIHTVRPLPPRDAERAAPARVAAPRRTRHTRSIGRRPLLAAAAAAVILASAGGLLLRGTHSDDAGTVADRVLAAGDARRVVHGLPGGGTATLVRSRSMGRAVLVTTDLQPAPTGSVLQLWLQDRSGRLTSAGFVRGGGDQVVVLGGDATEATGAGITVEPASGSDQPTTTPILFVALG